MAQLRLVEHDIMDVWTLPFGARNTESQEWAAVAWPHAWSDPLMVDDAVTCLTRFQTDPQIVGPLAAGLVRELDHLQRSGEQSPLAHPEGLIDWASRLLGDPYRDVLDSGTYAALLLHVTAA